MEGAMLPLNETKCEVRDVGCSCECLLSYRLLSGEMWNTACQSCPALGCGMIFLSFSETIEAKLSYLFDEQLKIPGSYISECERNPFDMIKAHQPV